MHYFIVNVSSRTGKAQAIWDDIERYLKEKKIEYAVFYTEYEGHATELAAKISKLSEEEISLIVVGGDGTANEVINGLDKLDNINFGYIPTGSGNDLGRGLGLKENPIDLLQNILDRKGLYLMDLGLLTLKDTKQKRYFNISSGIGIDAVVCDLVKDSKLKKILNTIHLGNLTYSLLTLKALITMPESKLILTMDNGEIIKLDKMIFTVAMNHKWEGGGVPMAPKASSNDGLLSMCMVHGFRRGQALLAFPKLLSAKHEGIEGFILYNCKSCDIEIERPMIVHTDGETHGLHRRIRFECIPQALKIYGIVD